MCLDVLLMVQQFRALWGTFIKRDVRLLPCIQIRNYCAEARLEMRGDDGRFPAFSKVVVLESVYVLRATKR